MLPIPGRLPGCHLISVTALATVTIRSLGSLLVRPSLWVQLVSVWKPWGTKNGRDGMVTEAPDVLTNYYINFALFSYVFLSF